MGIFDYFYDYSKPSAPKTAGAASAMAVNQVTSQGTATGVAKTLNAIQSKLPPGSTVSYIPAKYDSKGNLQPGTEVVTIFNPNAPHDVPGDYDYRTLEFKGSLEDVAMNPNVAKVANAAATGRQVVLVDILSQGQADLTGMFNKTTEATMTVNRPGQYRLTYPAVYPKDQSNDITLQKVLDYSKGYPIETSTVNPITGQVQRQVLNPPINIIMRQVGTNPVNAPFYGGVSEEADQISKSIFTDLRNMNTGLPQPFKFMGQTSVGATQWLIGDIPRFAVKLEEAAVMKAREQIDFEKALFGGKAAQNAYVKRITAEQEGAYAGQVSTQYQKLYAFNREEVAPTLGIMGAFEAVGPIWRAGSRALGVLKSPEARSSLIGAFLPQKRILAEADFSGFTRAIERGEILPKGPERVFKIQVEKINPDVLAKVREMEGTDMIRSLSPSAIENFGPQSKAVMIPGFIPKSTFPESYILKQVRVITPEGEVQVVNEMVPKGKVRLRALQSEQTAAETLLNVRKVELIGQGGIQVQKVAEGIKPTGKVDLLGRDLRQVIVPRVKSTFEGIPTGEANPEILELFRLGRAVKAEKRIPNGIPEPEIPFMKSVYDKPEIASIPRSAPAIKPVELVSKERILPGIRIIGRDKSTSFETLFGKTRGEGLEMKFFPDTYKAQKFIRKVATPEGVSRFGPVREATTYTFEVPEVKQALAEQRALGEKFKNIRKLTPTESQPLFRDIVQFEKLGERPKRTPFNFLNEAMEKSGQKTLQANRIPLLKEKPFEFPALSKTETTTKPVSIFERLKTKFGEMGKVLETKWKIFEKSGSGSILGNRSTLFGGITEKIKGSGESTFKGKLLPFIRPTSIGGERTNIRERGETKGRTLDRGKIIPIIKPTEKITQRTSQGQAQSQLQAEKQRRLIIFSQPPILKLKPPEFIGGEDIPPDKPEPPQAKQIKLDKVDFFNAATGGAKPQGWNTFAKQGDIWVKVNKKPQWKSEAEALGAEVVDNTTAAQFKVARAAGKPSGFALGGFNPFKFSKSKRGDSFMEKNKFRIDTQGEFEGITVKGWLTRRQKNIYGR